MVYIDLNATGEQLEAEIEVELTRSRRLHEEVFSTLDEGFGVITEEYFEVVEAFRTSKEKYPEGNVRLRRELVQLAAMCLKMSDSFYEGGVFRDIDLFDQRALNGMEGLGKISIAYYRMVNCYVTEELSHTYRKNIIKREVDNLYTQCVRTLLGYCVHQTIKSTFRRGNLKVQEGVKICANCKEPMDRIGTLCVACHKTFDDA